MCSSDLELGGDGSCERVDPTGIDGQAHVGDRAGDAEAGLGHVNSAHLRLAFAFGVGGAAHLRPVGGVADVRRMRAEKIRIQRHDHVGLIQVQDGAEGFSESGAAGSTCATATAKARKRVFVFIRMDA